MIENSNAAATAPYVAWKNAFAPWEVDQTVALCDRLLLQDAGVGTGDGYVDRSIRVSRTARVPRNAETEALYSKIDQLVKMVNQRVYQFDLTGFAEAFQYTIYDASEGGYFTWHVDQGETLPVNRKLSFSLQLSGAEEYDGGDLELFTSSKVAQAPRDRGTLIAFPAYTVHRVAPLTRGRRRSLVIWTMGPKFR